jgi:gliding motility-associated-like protein
MILKPSFQNNPEHMRLFLITIIFFCFNFNNSKGQNFGTWTWMKGSQTPGTPAVNGTIGVPNSANNPPPMIEPAGFTDLQGRFWVYGGSQLSSGAPPSAFQMWMFDPSTNNWTWMNGPSTPLAPANYGTQGIPSPTNHPGIRAGVSTWTDQDGNFWLFGNINPFALNNNNDLWKYDVATNEWIWMKGSNVTNNPGSYGTQGVPAMSNNPSARGRSSNWVDNNGDLWLYGGYCFCGNNYLLDDVWRYNIASNMWTWMGGSNSSMIPPNFGVMGVTSPTNTPGGRYSGSTWKDMNGDFWLYSGVSASAFFNQNAISDLWKYSPSSNLWTWMGGSNNVFLTDTFDVKCTPNTGYPAACDINPVSWIDDCGKLWQFGGEVRDFTAIGYTNLLWFYDPASSSFNWQGGSNTIMQPGIYGTQGVATSLNYPPSAMGGTGFKDNQGNFWMFGGCITPASPGAPCETNTLWKFVPDSACSASATPPQASINVNTPSLCDPLQINFQSGSNNPAYSYQWNFGDNSSSQNTASTANAAHSFSSPGIYTVSLIVSAAGSCFSGVDTATFQVDLSNVIPLQSFIAATSCTNYTAPWGAVYTQSGLYSDTIAASNGCDSIINLTLNITGFPTVNASSVSGTCGQPNGTATATATGGAGNYAYSWSNGATGNFISGLSSGSYSVVATDQNGCSSTSQVIVITAPAAGVTLTASDTILGLNETAVLQIIGGDTYNWSPNTGLSCDDCPSVVASPSSSTTYTVTGTDTSGCPYLRVINVLVDIVCNELFVPNIFSPNGIGNAENEKLCVYSNCIKSMNLGIYNRWGELIFTTDDQAACWDGTYKGEPVMTGVYSYRLFVEQFDGEKIERNGNITLTR